MTEVDTSALVARLAALEERVERLEDEKAITELLARYGYYADAKLDDEYYALFTENCVMDVSSGQQPEPYEVVRWEGRDKLRQFLTERTAQHDNGFYGRSMHAHGNNLAIKVNGDTAVATSYSLILHQDGATLKLLGASVNEWQMAKVAGTWLIQERKRRMLGAPDTADVVRATE